MTKKELLDFLKRLPDNAVVHLEMYDRRWRNVDCLMYEAERNIIRIGHWKGGLVDLEKAVPVQDLSPATCQSTPIT
jgi:hypothetical protein